LKSFVKELKRRNVFRVGLAYIVIAWLTAQVLQVVFESFETPAWVMKTILTLMAAGLPFALFFAWAFELTPDGIRREHEVDRTQSITPNTGRKLDFVIIGLLILALGYFAFDKFALSEGRDAALVEATTQAMSESPGSEVPATVSTEQPAATEAVAKNSIAVLPFVNMSSDTEQEYFSDGISEEILNALSKIPDLHVTSRSSAFSFKGKDIDIPTVAAQLGVANVLEGSVRKSGMKVRITAQLIEAESDRHLWSETYDRELVDIFAIQDEISAAIVTALKEHLDAGDISEVLSTRRPTTSTQAYEAYLRGRHLIVQRTQDSVAGAVEEFSEAIRLDPEFALAYAELAIAYTLSINDQYGELTWPVAQALALPLARKAMELDPMLSESHAAAGMVIWNLGPPPETFTHFENALRLDPNNAQILLWLALAYDSAGDYEKVIPLGEKLLRIDPLSIPGLGNLAANYVQVGRDEESEILLSNLATIAPANAQNIRGAIQWQKGEFADSAFFHLQALQLENNYPNARRDLAWSLALMGLSDDTLAIGIADWKFIYLYLGRYDLVVKDLTRSSPADQAVIENQRLMAQSYASVGDYENALPLLETVWTDSGRTTGTAAFSGFDIYDIAALIAARKAGQTESGTDNLVAAISSELAQQKAAGRISFNVDLSEGFAAWYAGDQDGAVSALLSAVKKGLYLPLDRDYLKDLYALPGFEVVREAQIANVERDRTKFLAVVCGDNPYADVWQPLEGSCE
jgi:TolB-like protein